MCKFCTIEEDRCGAYNILETLEYGAGVRASLDIYVGEDYGQLSLCKDISDDGKNWCELESESKRIRIKYCPFCGRKL